MKASLRILGIILILGAGALFFIVSGRVGQNKPQNLNPQVEQTGSATSSPTNGAKVKKGTFMNVSDKYAVSGQVSIEQENGTAVLKIDDTFTISSGPDLYIYFGNNGAYVDSAQVARLRSFQGSQEYGIPDSIDPNSFDEVWIWCRAFSEPFAVAKLEM
jgi:hypothetical protein